MAKCKYDKCDKAVTGRQVFCSDKCRKAQSRTDKSDTSNNSDIKSDIPKQGPTVEQVVEIKDKLIDD